MGACVLIQWTNLIILNKIQEKKRVANGKSARIVDQSMQNHYHDVESPETESSVGNQAFMDLTDRQNDEFVYLY